jgi:hypothetical protein
VVLVKKKTGDLRFCIDYRRLNSVTKPDRYPIPLIEELIDKLREQTFYSTLDLKDGYWQVPVKQEDIEKTAFTVQGLGHFEFVVMPFGLSNAPATFQRMMSELLKDQPGTLVYMDDIIVSGSTLQEHDENLNRVLHKLQEHGLSLNDKKCRYRQRQVDYLGHTVSAAGLKPNGEKVQAILALRPPSTINEVRTFLGMAGYYRKFIPGFGTIAEPLTSLTLKESKFQWGQAQTTAYQTLKLAVATCPVLQFPKSGGQFCVSTDASDVGIGATLTQYDSDGNERVLAFASRVLTKAEKNLAVIERECLAIVWALEKWRHYLLGCKFVVRSDHKPLQWLHSVKENNAKLTRWVLKLAEFEFTIQHIDGSKNVVPDALSRLPITVSTVSFDGGMSMAEMGKLQIQDGELAPIIFALKNPSAKPGNAPARLLGSSRRFGELWNQLKIDVGVLIREMDDGKKLIVVPQLLRRTLVKDWHNQGHLGVTATVARLQERFYWPGLGTDVSNWIGDCSTCNRRKPWTEEPKPPLRSNLATGPWECCAMDIVGPLPLTRHGNRFILTMCDTFTKWPEAVALPDQRASTIAQAVVDCIVANHGVPQKILSDQGANFESKLFHHLCRILGVRKLQTTAYHPQGNGLCERFNGTLSDIISTLVNHHGDDWDEVLGLALFHYRSKVHSAIGVSPFVMLYGRQPRQVPDVELPRFAATHALTSSSGDYMGNLEMKLSRLHQQTREIQAQRLLRSSETTRKTLPPLTPGDKVFLKNNCRRHKFDDRFKGPFRVSQQLDDQTVLLDKDTVLYRTHRGRIKTRPRHWNDYLHGEKYDSFFRHGGKECRVSM